MRIVQGHFVLITFAAGLLVSKTLCKLPPDGSFCSANHFCYGDEDLGENQGETNKRGSEENEKEENEKEENEMEEGEKEENEMEEMVRQQYEDFPTPEVTLKQLEEEKLK